MLDKVILIKLSKEDAKKAVTLLQQNRIKAIIVDISKKQLEPILNGGGDKKIQIDKENTEKARKLLIENGLYSE